MSKIINAIVASFLGTISSIWGMTITGLILYRIEATTFMWCMFVLYVPLTIIAVVLLQKVNAEGVD